MKELIRGDSGNTWDLDLRPEAAIEYVDLDPRHGTDPDTGLEVYAPERASIRDTRGRTIQTAAPGLSGVPDWPMFDLVGR